MSTLQPTILLISHDVAVCSAVRAALQHRGPSCAISTVATFAAAQHTVADLAPDVIVLQESSLRTLLGTPGVCPSLFADVVAALAGFAPVVILGKADQPASLAALVAAGAADFIPAGESHLPDAAACVERRLHTCRRLSLVPERSAGDCSCSDPRRAEHFGELLRHELNNPLTGILGNAELLLAESRRQNPPQLSEPGVKRLETIAALAVRMRETVRRLSQALEFRG